jgi:molybdopterin synthase sulfur carrier subunit
MSVKINIPSYLQNFTGDQEAIEVTGNTTGECLLILSKQFPEIGHKIFNEGGELIEYVSIFVNGEFTNTDELAKPVHDGDELHVFYILGGG